MFDKRTRLRDELGRREALHEVYGIMPPRQVKAPGRCSTQGPWRTSIFLLSLGKLVCSFL